MYFQIWGSTEGLAIIYSSWRSYIGAAVTVSKWGVYLPSNYAEYLGVEMGGLKQRRNHRPTN